MNVKLIKSLPVVLAALFCGSLSASAQFVNVSNNGSNFIDSVHRRIGHSVGTFGKQYGQWATIGDAATNPGLEQPNTANLYGLISHWDGDRVFFGLDHIGSNRSDAVIGWGNDDATAGLPDDLLQFRFYRYNNTITTVATMMPNGNVGIGTTSPSHQLHTTGGVRFQGLPNCSAATNIVGIDANGVLCRYPLPTAGGVSLTCATAGYMPKVTAANTLGCSQVFDNGTSVGIGTTSGFTYSSLSGGRLGYTVPPSSGTIRFEVNGVERSLAEIVTSDAQYKENINDIPDPVGIVKDLAGHTFTWNRSAKTNLGADNGLHIGFIAQELQDVLPELVIADENGDLGVNYIEVIPLLTEAIKQQQSQIEELQALVRQGAAKKAPATTGDAVANGNYLFQNRPNPFGSETEIRYNIKSMSKSAAIVILNLNGQELQKYPVAATGEGSVKVDGGKLQAGIYLYSLVVDGQEIDTKKMVLEK